MANECKYVIFKDSVVVHFKNKTLLINKTDSRYNKVIEAIGNKAFEEIPKLADNEATEQIRNLLKIRRKTK